MKKEKKKKWIPDTRTFLFRGRGRGKKRGVRAPLDKGIRRGEGRRRIKKSMKEKVELNFERRCLRGRGLGKSSPSEFKIYPGVTHIVMVKRGLFVTI